MGFYRQVKDTIMFTFEAYNPVTKKTAKITFTDLKDAFVLLTSAEVPDGWTFKFTTTETTALSRTTAYKASYEKALVKRGKLAAKTETTTKKPRGRPKGWSPKKNKPVATMSIIDQLNGSGTN